MDDPAGVPPSIPNEEPSVAPLPTFGSNPKIELPQVPSLPEENKPPLGDSSEIPIVEVPDKPPEVKSEPIEPKKPVAPAPEPFLVPPRPVGDSEKIPSSTKTDFSVTTAPPPPVEPRKKSGKSVVLGLVAIFVIAGGILGYYFFQKGGMDIGEKAAGCDGAYKVCGLNGACGAVNDCACFIDYTTCSFADWSCCFTQDPVPVPVTPYPTSPAGEAPICSVNLTKEGGDGICLHADGAQVKAKACLNAVDCVGGSRSVTYTRTVAYCGGTSCDGVCGNAGEQRTLTVPAGQLCVEETVGCTVENLCGNCQVDIDDYGERAWQDSGCTTPTSPSPSPTLTPIPSLTPIPAACLSVTVSVSSGTNINSLKIGDIISFTTTFSGSVEDVAVELKKAGVSVRKFFANGPKTSTWTTPSYTIESNGSYEVVVFVKSGGVWK